MIIYRSGKSNIKWWIDNLEVSFKLIIHGNMYASSTRTGWGRITKPKTSVQGDIGQKEKNKTTLML